VKLRPSTGDRGCSRSHERPRGAYQERSPLGVLI
jgi:hypothetical protein